jgi:hypothetical protein
VGVELRLPGRAASPSDPQAAKLVTDTELIYAAVAFIVTLVILVAASS